MLSQKGERASFLINVRFRQNSSWQGTLHWTNTNRVVHFRSALELIRLIDSANTYSATWENAEKDTEAAECG